MPDLSKVDPSAARQLLSFELTLWCRRAGVRHSEVGDRLGVSRAAASQMLAGKNLPSKPALEVLLNLVGAEDRIPLLCEVLSIARGKGSNADRSESGHNLVRGGDLAVGLAAVAETIDVFDFGRVTPVVEESATGTARFCWFLAERALHEFASGSHDTRAQVENTTEAANRSTVSVRVVPAGRGPVCGFRVFHSTAWTVAYQETLTAAHYFTDPASLADYEHTIDYLERVAFDEDRSRTLLAQLAQNL